MLTRQLKPVRKSTSENVSKFHRLFPYIYEYGTNPPQRPGVVAKIVDGEVVFITSTYTDVCKLLKKHATKHTDEVWKFNVIKNQNDVARVYEYANEKFKRLRLK